MLWNRHFLLVPFHIAQQAEQLDLQSINLKNSDNIEYFKSIIQLKLRTNGSFLMTKSNYQFRSRLVKFGLSLLVAIVGSLPFVIWSEAIQRLSLAGYIGLLVACLLTNATVFLPASGIAFTISASMILNPLYCAIVGGIGTACGELVSYYCGRVGKNIIEQTDIFLTIQKYVTKYGVISVLIFAFLPLPLFDFVGITAGATKMPLLKYILPCMIGKIMKMFMYVFIVGSYLRL